MREPRTHVVILRRITKHFDNFGELLLDLVDSGNVSERDPSRS